MTTRRDFLASSALFASWFASGCRVGSRAISEEVILGSEGKNFIFVTNVGGWDVTRVFAPLFDNETIDMESDAVLASAGNIQYVSHETRPSVDQFFSRYKENCLVINGILVPSLAHEICTKFLLTGTSADAKPDVPAMIASRFSQSLTLPHAVISGPSFPGEFGTVVTRTDSVGRLDDLLSSKILAQSDIPVGQLGQEAEALIDSYLENHIAQQKTKGISGTRLQKLNEVYLNAVDRARELKNIREEINFARGNNLQERMGLAVSLLAKNISRCVSISFNRYGWDSHASNDLPQTLNFEDLFSGLSFLLDSLKANQLDGNTVVVVLSEMGRTPRLNANGGKDHWPYTSALVIGPEIKTNRVFGGYNELFNGMAVDRKTGEILASGEAIHANSFCAGLLNLAGIDHRLFYPGVPSFSGFLG